MSRTAVDSAMALRLAASWLDEHPEIDKVLSVYVSDKHTMIHVDMALFSQCVSLGIEKPRTHEQNGSEFFDMEVTPGVELTACRLKMVA
jgi:hypothetical protein